MQATARMASVVSSTLPARRRLIRDVRRHSRTPMKSLLILITLITVAFQSARAADKPTFFAARGTYRLSATTTLIVSEEEQTPHYSLKSEVQQNNTGTTVSHGGELTGAKTGESFLIYWDTDSQTLWWATARRLGYCDIRTPQSARSSSHDRATPFKDYDKFPTRPAAFMTELEHSLPIRP